MSVSCSESESLLLQFMVIDKPSDKKDSWIVIVQRKGISMDDLEYSLIEAVSVSSFCPGNYWQWLSEHCCWHISNLFRAVDESDLYFSSWEGIVPPKPISKISLGTNAQKVPKYQIMKQRNDVSGIK